MEHHPDRWPDEQVCGYTWDHYIPCSVGSYMDATAQSPSEKEWARLNDLARTAAQSEGLVVYFGSDDTAALYSAGGIVCSGTHSDIARRAFQEAGVAVVDSNHFRESMTGYRSADSTSQIAQWRNERLEAKALDVEAGAAATAAALRAQITN